jgi:hypothetical protein
MLHSFLSWAASDPLENADVGAKVLTIAIAVTIARNLGFIGSIPPLDSLCVIQKEPHTSLIGNATTSYIKT